MDTVGWGVTSSKRVITTEVYKNLLIDIKGLVIKEINGLWKTISGPRINYFWWQLLWDKLLVRSELAKSCSLYNICSLCR